MQQAVTSSDLKERISVNAVSSLGRLQMFKNEGPWPDISTGWPGRKVQNGPSCWFENLRVRHNLGDLDQGWRTFGTLHSVLFRFVFLLPHQSLYIVKNVCVCVCVYIYIYIYTHTYTHTYSIYIYIYIYTHTLYSGPGSSVGIAADYGLDGPGSNHGGDETGPGAHPASCTMGAGSFPGVKCGRGVLMATHPLLVPRSWKSRAIPLPTVWATPGL